VPKSLAELAQSCLKVDLELQLICRPQDNPSWCGTDGRHDGSTIASSNLHLKIESSLPRVLIMSRDCAILRIGETCIKVTALQDFSVVETTFNDLLSFVI
jgi:hypothetical protein